MVFNPSLSQSIDLPQLIKITSVQTNTARTNTSSSSEQQQKTILQGNHCDLIIPRFTSIKRN